MCMHTRATAPCSTLTDIYIYIVQRCKQIKNSCHQGSGDYIQSFWSLITNTLQNLTCLGLMVVK